VCFICSIPGHYMTACPEWKKPQPTASYMGSASSGLDFYHVDLPDGENTGWLNISNCDVIMVRKGDISLAQLERELSDIFCKEWSWQVRELMHNRFLVRFPPHKRVEDIKNFPSFNLRKEGVQVEVIEWIGEMDHLNSLSEVWIQLTGIPPKWCGWRVFAQMASRFGLLLEVDWSSLFKSLYEHVRLKIACRNPKKKLIGKAM
jgi:hypothetical protein